ncbi:MAG: hypothetical protein K9I47_08990 [Bacteroidales bacterium]|nr:hypothetical protein [Bacteroidales bacterium]
MIRWMILIIAAGLAFTSCMKDLEDDKTYPVEQIPDEVKLDMVELTPEYIYRKYYDLSSNQVVASHEKTAWDLAFESLPEGDRIFLNSAKFMYAGNTGEKEFEKVTSAGDTEMVFDKPSLSRDSTAIGNWRKPSPDVYVIDRGIDAEGNTLGYKKIKFHTLEEGVYTIEFANLDGTERHETTVPKDSVSNLVMFSFENGGEVKNLQPASGNWDLVFTQYTKTLFTNEGEPYPYLVVGVLGNRKRISTAEVQYSFSDVDPVVTDTVTLFPYADLIGYDWKNLQGDVETGDVSYTMRSPLSYIIHEKDKNIFYKLGFTDFYNENGRKGYPSFEYQRLIKP